MTSRREDYDSSQEIRSGSPPLVLLRTFPYPSRMSVIAAQPSYPPLAIMFGDFEKSNTPSAEVGGIGIHRTDRMTDW